MQWQKMKSCWFVLVALLLAGCAQDFIPPRPLPADPTGSDPWGAVAAAVRPDGDQDYAWSEQVAGQGRLVHVRERVGRTITQTILAPPGPGDYLYPQLAVTDAGTTYMAWQAYSDTHHQTTDCWEMIPWSGAQAACHLLANPVSGSSGLPFLAARGQAVYAVYGVTQTSGSRLRYRQLAVLDRSQGAASGQAVGVARDLAGAGVDQAGNLYVAWLENSSSVSATLHYNDNAGSTTGDMVHERIVARGLLAGVSLSVDNQTPSTAYLAAVDRTDPTSDQVDLIICRESCVISNTLPLLDPAQHWRVLGGPSVAARPDGAYVVLAAANDATRPAAGPNAEIWLIILSQGQVGQPLRITYQGAPNGTPRVVVTALSFAIGWRLSPAPGSFADAFVYDPVNGIRQVSTSAQGAGAYGAGYLAARDDYNWVAGIWIDPSGTTDTRLVPWVSANAYRHNLVLVPTQ